MRETNCVQLSVKRYFSGVTLSASGGSRRELTVCRTPFDAYTSRSTSSACETLTLLSVGTIFKSGPSIVDTGWESAGSRASTEYYIQLIGFLKESDHLTC